MTDWSKPQPCMECGRMVKLDEKHNFEDCKKWKKSIKDALVVKDEGGRE